MVYTYYMMCVTCVLIEKLVPARPPKKLKVGHTSPNDHRRPHQWFLEADLQLNIPRLEIKCLCYHLIFLNPDPPFCLTNLYPITKNFVKECRYIKIDKTSGTLSIRHIHGLIPEMKIRETWHINSYTRCYF